MTGGVVNIGYVELVGASLLMLVAGIVSWRMGLGQTRRIAVSTVRAFLQLLAMGLLLGYLFKYQTWWLVCLVLLGMCVAATQIATGPHEQGRTGALGRRLPFHHRVVHGHRVHRGGRHHPRRSVVQRHAARAHLRHDSRQYAGRGSGGHR